MAFVSVIAGAAMAHSAYACEPEKNIPSSLPVFAEKRVEALVSGSGSYTTELGIVGNSPGPELAELDPFDLDSLWEAVLADDLDGSFVKSSEELSARLTRPIRYLGPDFALSDEDLLESIEEDDLLLDD